jgi:mRNA interferase YafQ
MLSISSKKKFERDVELATRRGKDLSKLKTVLAYLVEQESLPKHYKDHPLEGEFNDCRECHTRARLAVNLLY